MKRLIAITRFHLRFGLIILIVGLWGSQALFHSGLYTAHDIWHNVARFYWYAQALSQREWLPAWIAPLAGGYGYPLFIFSYPFPWLIGYPLVVLGFSLETAIKVLFGGSFIAAGFSMYGFSFSLFRSRLAALAAAALYQVAPYHFLTTYVAAAMGIAVAYALIPLLFWGIREIGQEKYVRGIVLLSLGMAGVITSHLILALLLSLFALVWSIFVLLQAKHKLKIIKWLIFGSLLGLGLAAFYLVPFGVYSKLIRANDPGAGFAKLYQTNFATIKQLLYSPWGFGPIISNAKDGEISLQVGIAQWLAFFAAIFMFGMRWLKRATWLKVPLISVLFKNSDQAKSKRNAVSGVLLLLFALSVFAIWEFSKPMWDFAAKWLPLDYPFRLLVVAVVFGSLLAGQLVITIKNRYARLLATCLLVSVAMYTNRNHLRVNLYTDIPLSDYVQAEKTTNTMDEYLPLVADRSLTNKPYVFIEPELPSSNSFQALKQTSFDVVASQSGTVRLGQWAFPGQTVTLNGKKTQTQVANDGRIQLELPAGQHTVTISYQKTRPHTFGYAVTLVSFGTLIYLTSTHVKRKKHL